MKLWIKRVSIVIVICKISSLLTTPQSTPARPTPAPRSAVSLGSKSAEPTYASISPQSFQPPVPKQRFSIEADRSKTHSNVSKATQKEVLYADLKFGEAKPTPPPVPYRSKKPGLQDGPKIDRSTKPQPTPPPVVRSSKPSYLKNEAIPNGFDNEPRMMSRAEIRDALKQSKTSKSSSVAKTFEEQQNQIFALRESRIKEQIQDPNQQKDAVDALKSEQNQAKNTISIRTQEPVYATVKRPQKK